MKKTFLILIVLALTILSGCNFMTNEFGKLSSAFKGREAIYQSYNENSEIIDRIEAKSMDIGADDKFARKDSEGNITKNSGVLSITVGGKTMTHVGSSAIIYEKGLINVFEEFAKTIDVQNFDRSVPFINRMVNDLKNFTAGQEYVLLIRSQTGNPLATFAGSDISYFATDIEKSTGFIIDGKYLLVYRCDYSIIPMSLLK
ncbi:DUF5052 family protein (plasmid) [Paenibacillus thiaminolyticus]|uniref:DUF5052 family protein n=1 Tax=Paenibacillus thiaminolyticus TaxID=49283 RepID=UPI00232B2C77|nr:DUF5052 family protein [Paenibacillus thiaminolyticus]WCF11588.1 DUF5052 family protein [Paenibacillus thiaminolyticus]